MRPGREQSVSRLERPRWHTCVRGTKGEMIIPTDAEADWAGTQKLARGCPQLRPSQEPGSENPNALHPVSGRANVVSPCPAVKRDEVRPYTATRVTPESAVLPGRR